MTVLGLSKLKYRYLLILATTVTFTDYSHPFYKIPDLRYHTAAEFPRFSLTTCSCMRDYLLHHVTFETAHARWVGHVTWRFPAPANPNKLIIPLMIGESRFNCGIRLRFALCIVITAHGCQLPAITAANLPDINTPVLHHWSDLQVIVVIRINGTRAI